MQGLVALERVWVVGDGILPVGPTLPVVEGVEIKTARSPEDLFHKISGNERISLLASIQDCEAIERELGTRVVVSRIFEGPASSDMLALHIASILDEIHLEHDLEIAESVAWKSNALGGGVPVDFLGKVILDIFLCRDLPAMEKTLLANCRALAPIQRIAVRANPPYAPMIELAKFHLAIPVQFQGDLLAHIYVEFAAKSLQEQENYCELVGDALLGISDAVALAIERNSAIHIMEETGRIWEASFDAIADPVVILDYDFRILRANRAYADLVQNSRKHLLGKECALFQRQELMPYLEYTSSEWEFTFGKDYYRVFMDKIQETQSKGRIILRLHNTTKEKQLRERLLAHNQVADLGILIGSVAHEINNPIGGISMYAQMLLKEFGNDHPARGDLQLIAEAADRCKRIVQTMLSLVRRSDNSRMQISLSSCLQEAMSLVASEVKRFKIRVHIETQENEFDRIVASRNQILQIFFHLLQQTIHTLAATAKESSGFRGMLKIRLYTDSDCVVVEFSDNARIISQVSESSIAFNVVKILIEEQGGRLEYMHDGKSNIQRILFPLTQN